MPNQYHYLSLAICLTAPTIGCDLPEKVVGETADPPLMNAPPEELPQEDPPQDPQDPPPQDTDGPQDPPPPEPDPQDPPPPVEPPSATPTIVAGIAGTLAVDDTWLFIGAGEAPQRVLKSGGEPVPVADSVPGDAASVTLMALDDTHVYWTGYTGVGSQYKVVRAPKLGGEATLVTDAPAPNLAPPAAMVVDADYLYLSAPDIYNSNDDYDKLTGVIRRVPKAGGEGIDIAQVYANSVAVSDNYVYWPRATALGGGELFRADKDGQNPTVVVSEFGQIQVVVAEGDRLYWVFGDAGQQIARTAIEGEAPSTLFTESGDQYYVGFPAPTPGGLYWLRPGGADTGAVLTVNLQGQFSELVTAPAANIHPIFWGTVGAQIAADETAVYWSYDGAQGGSPRVYRMAR